MQGIYRVDEFLTVLPKDSVVFMTTIRLTTWVNAPMERCFLLATNAEFYSSRNSAQSTPSNLQVGDTLHWRAWGWGIPLSLTSRIDSLRPFTYFCEVMIKGRFRSFQHEHHFAPMDDGTRMRDEVHYIASRGPLGKLIDHFVLRKCIMKMLAERHLRLKRAAESSEWRTYLHPQEQERNAVVEHLPKVSKMQRFA